MTKMVDTKQSEWKQEWTDLLVEKILGWHRHKHRGDLVWLDKNNDPVVPGLLNFKPQSDLNHCMMLVESEWVKSRYEILIEYHYDEDDKIWVWWVVFVDIKSGERSAKCSNVLSLAFCLLLKRLVKGE